MVRCRRERVTRGACALPLGRLALAVAVAASGVALAPAPARAAEEARVALVIGNSAYASRPLRNPANDARDVAAALRRLGFEVDVQTDLDQKEMKRALLALGQRLREKRGTGLFYFSGHGVQANGQNYLLPVGGEIETEADVDIEAVRADEVIARMEGAGTRLNIVILDACRDNPLPGAARSSARGLAFMNAPVGTVIAYATAPGRTASDNPGGSNGLYTQELLANLEVPGLRLEDVFQRTRVAVQAASDGAQVPWESSSLTAPVYLMEGAGPARPAHATPPSVTCPAGTERRGEACVATAVACPSGSRWDAGAGACVGANEPPSRATATATPPLSSNPGALPARIVDIRVGAVSGDKTRIIFELSQPASYMISHQEIPTASGIVSELLVDIAATGSFAAHGQPGLVDWVRVKPQGSGSVALIRLKTASPRITDMTLAQPDRIVIDVARPR